MIDRKLCLDPRTIAREVIFLAKPGEKGRLAFAVSPGALLESLDDFSRNELAPRLGQLSGEDLDLSLLGSAVSSGGRSAFVQLDWDDPIYVYVLLR